MYEAKIQASRFKAGSWALVFLWLLVFGSSSLSAQPLVQTTPYTRYFLLAPTAANARFRLGITGTNGGGTTYLFDTNIFVTVGTNVTVENPLILTNVLLVGGVQGLNWDTNIFAITGGTNFSFQNSIVITNATLSQNTISPVVDLGNVTGTFNFDASASTEFKLSLTGNASIGATNWNAGHPVNVRVANTGSFAVTWTNAMYWIPNGNATQVTNDWGAGISDVFHFFKDSTTIYASDKEGVGTSGGGGSISGGGTAAQVAYYSSGSAITGSTNLTFSAPNLTLNGSLNLRTNLSWTIGTNLTDSAGIGTPEGNVTAGIGSLYRRIDGQIGYSVYIKQSGTGSTGWAQMPTVYPQAFGAKGNGSTDDTTALQNWLTYCGTNNFAATLPPGTYLFTNTLTVPTGLTVAGSGALSLLFPTNTETAIQINAGQSNIVFRDLAFGGFTSEHISIVNATNIAIRDCYFTGATRIPTNVIISAIRADGGEGIKIDHNIFYGNGNVSTNFSTDYVICFGQNVPVQHSRIANCEVYNYRSKVPILAVACGDIDIQGNFVNGAGYGFQNSNGYGIAAYANTAHGGSNVRIRNNFITNTFGMGIYMINHDFSDATGNRCYNVVLSQTNVLTEPSGIQLNTCFDSAAVGNVVSNALMAHAAINLVGSKRCLVAQNWTFLSPFGIWSEAGASNVFLANQIISPTGGAGLAILDDDETVDANYVNAAGIGLSYYGNRLRLGPNNHFENNTTPISGPGVLLSNTFWAFDGTSAMHEFGPVVSGGGGGAFVGAVSNNVASAGLLAVDATKTNGIAATLAHMTNAFGLTGDTAKFINGAGALATPPGSVPVGTMVESGISATGVIPASTGTTGTNFVTSPLVVQSATNVLARGLIKANGAVFTNALPTSSGGTGTNGFFNAAIPYFDGVEMASTGALEWDYTAGEGILDLAHSAPSIFPQLQIIENATPRVTYFFADGFQAALGDYTIDTLGSGSNLRLQNQGTLVLRIGSSSSPVVGDGTTTTSRTNKFLYIPTFAGVPTGTPVVENAGTVPIGFDTVNTNFYVFASGAWRLIPAGAPGGANVPVGTMVESGISTTGVVPATGDSTGTNFIASPILISGVTNISAPGGATFNKVIVTNDFEIPGGTSLNASTLSLRNSGGIAKVVNNSTTASSSLELQGGTSETTSIGFNAGGSGGSTKRGSFDTNGQFNAFFGLAASSGKFTNTLTLPVSATPTTSLFGQIAANSVAWNAGRGAVQIFDGTANTYALATLASSTPANGQVPTFVTGGTITWQTPPAAASSPWTNDASIIKPLIVTNKLWLSDVSPYVVRIDTGGAFPIADNDRLLELNNFQTNVLTFAPEGGIMLGRNSSTFWNSIADNGESLVSVRVSGGSVTIAEPNFNQIYIGVTNTGNMGFFDVETTTNTAVLDVGVNSTKTRISHNSINTTDLRAQTVTTPGLALNLLDLGTVTDGTTVNLSAATNLYYMNASGSTVILNLPSVAASTNGEWVTVELTNTFGASQVISWKVATVSTALWRSESKSATTTITNGSGAHVTMSFTAAKGAWSLVSASGDALTIRLGRDQLKLPFPRIIDGVGCTYPNTNDFTTNTFMVPRFSGTGATNANKLRFATRVPTYFDTTVIPTASITVHLSAADTGAASYNIGFADVANSAVATATVGTWINLPIAADASGAYDDIESVSSVALTGWNSGLTPGHWWVIELNRDGTDASTVAQDLFELVIDYGLSQ